MTKGSGDARTQPLFFLITTAGTDRNSVCFEQHQKALDIIEGRKIDPTFYPVIYGASDEDDWSSEDVWYKANPSLGYTIDIEKVQNAYISAKENAAEENVFRQLRLNQWVKQSTRWMQMDKWDACSFAVKEVWQNSVDFFRSLDIPVRTLECCSGDLADLKVKSCDVEAWSPRQKKYFEVGSCSNLGDAQARRLGIRIKAEDGTKYFAHTLNNTVVAPPRMLIAFLENNLNADGTVNIPEPLRMYMGGKDKITK